MTVQVRNGNVEKALKIFKKKCSDKLYDYRNKQRFEKPSTKRHKAKKAAVAREKERNRYAK
jgi:ribosomal protein S21